MSEPIRYPLDQNIMRTKSTTGVGTAVNVQDFKNIQLSLATAGNANFTVKIQGSMIAATGFPNTAPDFSSAATVNNRWAYLASFDYLDPTNVIPGGTGYSSAGTDIVKNILVNVDGVRWLNCQITAIAAGSVTVDSVSFNNQ